jgi:hypothetical protein
MGCWLLAAGYLLMASAKLKDICDTMDNKFGTSAMPQKMVLRMFLKSQ